MVLDVDIGKFVDISLVDVDIQVTIISLFFNSVYFRFVTSRL